ncbi:MAG TPA: vitamin B12-dependent ribonucleotide reductase, partial [Calditrichia bacterium]|nr:vitamin B12-dependent ribonucleotide reductase [Calditrichia bacterium]
IPGMRFQPVFATSGKDPLDSVIWEQREARMMAPNRAPELITGIEAPGTWSQEAVNALTIFLNEKDRRSFRAVIARVANTITELGRSEDYFRTNEDAEHFNADLQYLLVHQMATFGHSVWMNVGVKNNPQCAQTFINSVNDSVESILDLAKTEGVLFKYGAGSGTNFSSIRSSRETLSDGSKASGPIAFLRGFDAFAGVFNNGRKNRPSAKTAILNADHPDIEAFIDCKADEEKRARALLDAGYNREAGDPYETIAFQNEQHMVRLPDEFMRALERDDRWHTRTVSDGRSGEPVKAKMLMDKIAQAVHLCGNPGIQFDTHINQWHTCSASGRINASSAFSETFFLNDTACMPGQLNLSAFLDKEGNPDTNRLRDAVRIMVTALDILVGHSSYPTENIAENTLRFRPVGLGCANLGSFLLSQGLAYDSDSGRAFAAVLFAIITGQAYLTGTELARACGTFSGYDQNRNAFLRVMEHHLRAVFRIDKTVVSRDLMLLASGIWESVKDEGEKYGFRNAQTTQVSNDVRMAAVMGCSAVGLDPLPNLLRYRRPVGGGMVKYIDSNVRNALTRLSYPEGNIAKIMAYLEEFSRLEGCPDLKESHLGVFDGAVPAPGGKRHVHYMAIIGMIAAVQPFLSGAVAKTVVVPEKTSDETIQQTIVRAWRLGLKTLTISRENARRTEAVHKALQKAVPQYGRPYRRHLPDERRSITHKMQIGEQEGFITVGMYEDGSPGEIFIVMAKEGSVISGLMDSFATAISLALQYGVPLKVLCDKFCDMRFEPSGFTNNPQIPMAKSMMDYIFSWLSQKFLSEGTGDSAKAETIELP